MPSSISFNDFTHIIAGKAEKSDRSREVINPATGLSCATVPLASSAQVEAAISAAQTAYPGWVATSIEDRRTAVKGLASIISDYREEFTKLLTVEQGKSLKTASREIQESQDWINDVAGHTIPKEVISLGDRKVTVEHLPVGVCATIIPWNFPFILMVNKIAPALLCGNVLIVKPAPTTPLCALKFIELAQKILPPGVLSVLCDSDDNPIGPVLTTHSAIARIAFTGSTETGKHILSSTASSIKRVTLELGGNDPAIICADVNLEKRIPQIFWSAFANSGQLCTDSKRLYVHDDIWDEFCDQFVAYAKTIKVGNGLEAGVDLGPVQNLRQFERVKNIIEDCKTNGYKFLTGGHDADPQFQSSNPGYFIPITIIANPPDDSRVVVEEPFGPIVPLLRWKDEADVIRRANNTAYGLASTIWTEDTVTADRLASQIEAGSVWINCAHQMHPQIPFSGHKTSGLGVEFGKQGLAEWCQVRATTRLNARL